MGPGKNSKEAPEIRPQVEANLIHLRRMFLDSRTAEAGKGEQAGYSLQQPVEQMQAKRMVPSAISSLARRLMAKERARMLRGGVGNHSLLTTLQRRVQREKETGG